MADGSSWTPHPRTFADILPRPGRILARCQAPSCGAATLLTIGPALYAALSHAALERLEDQLRCSCGARRGRLGPPPAHTAQHAPRARLYLFHT